MCFLLGFRVALSVAIRHTECRYSTLKGFCMSAAIHRLSTPRERIRRDQNEALTQALLPFLDDPNLDPRLARLVGEVKGLVDRRTASSNRWTFVMLSPSQNRAVVSLIRARSSRPMVAADIWALCFEHLRTDTGEIMLRREQIAEAVGVSAQVVSRIMSELVSFGAISRTLERLEGVKGPGIVRYFMNPNVATHLSGAARDDAQRSAPILELVGGVAHPSQRRARAAGPALPVL